MNGRQIRHELRGAAYSATIAVLLAWGASAHGWHAAALAVAGGMCGWWIR